MSLHLSQVEMDGAKWIRNISLSESKSSGESALIYFSICDFN